MNGARPQAVLFDLDGTLVDSAPDLAASANALRARQGLAALPLADYRPHGGSGARGMLQVAFGIDAGDPAFEPLRQAFLADYAERLLAQTEAFDGVAELLAALTGQGSAWGIVTNKALHLARPLVEHLPALQGCKVLVGGDCTPHRKPHPAPLQLAMARLRLPAEACVYIGDDPRDIACARAAGVKAWGVRWGYLGTALPIEAWGADALFDSPHQLMTHLLRA